MSIKNEYKESIRNKADRRFVYVLAIVSIIGFIGVISKSLFGIDISSYMESIWMFVIGIGLIIEIRMRRLIAVFRGGLTRDNFANVITVIVGWVAILAGILSYPKFNIEYPAFEAVKGILSVIAIVLIVLQTWFVGKRIWK